MKRVQDISETIDWSPRVQTITLKLHYTNIPLWHCPCMNERWTPQTEKLLGAGQWQDPPEDVRHSASHEVRWFGQTRPHQRPAGGHFALAVLGMFLFAPRSTYWSHRWVIPPRHMNQYESLYFPSFLVKEKKARLKTFVQYEHLQYDVSSSCSKTKPSLFCSNTDLPAAHEPRFCSQVSFFINWYETVLQKRRALRTNPTRLDSLIGVYCYMVKFKALQISREHESQYLDEN